MREEVKLKIALTAIGAVPLVAKIAVDAVKEKKYQRTRKAIAKEQEFEKCVDNVQLHLAEIKADQDLMREQRNQIEYEEIQFLHIVKNY